MFVYSDAYDLGWSTHVFPTDKYKRVFITLSEEVNDSGLDEKVKIVSPESVTKEELLLVHPEAYLKELESLTENPIAAVYLYEAPLDRKALDAVYSATGGTVLAATEAVKRGEVWVNIGGGFHHCYAEHGEGFCFVNDIAVAIRVAQNRGLVKKVLIVDCDLHQGNGTSKIFEEDDSVFTLSIHQEKLYPKKEKSSLDIGLDKNIGDSEYLSLLEGGMNQALDAGKYDLLFYVAGADPFMEDQLGDLKLTKEGMAGRDRLVLSAAEKHNLPVAVAFAGGYAKDTQDVVDIHVELCRQVRDSNARRSFLI